MGVIIRSIVLGTAFGTVSERHLGRRLGKVSDRRRDPDVKRVARGSNGLLLAVRSDLSSEYHPEDHRITNKRTPNSSA